MQTAELVSPGLLMAGSATAAGLGLLAAQWQCPEDSPKEVWGHFLVGTSPPPAPSNGSFLGAWQQCYPPAAWGTG